MSTSTAIQKLWECSEIPCTSDQTTKPRTKTGRKVVSDTFGRNKSATKAIPDDVWHWQCRKGYQKARYAAEKQGPQGPALLYLRHLRQQLVRIKLWRPESTFIVQLSLPAAGRLSKYHDLLRRQGSNTAAAATALPALDITPAHADFIDIHFAGRARSIDFLMTTILTWIEGEFSQERMTQMPPVEFLINDPGEGEEVDDPAANFQAWLRLQGNGATTGGVGSSKRKREGGDDDDDDDDDEKSEVRPPRKVPRLIALHGPRPRTKQAGAPSGAAKTEPASGDTSPAKYSSREYEAADALLLLRGAAPLARPIARVSVASLLH